ncbi:MAG: hypothetical protein NZ898_09400 [Myxococcota bacterium]|nr:hypothetical protein [Myxococcota bacterium]MDW8362798.1 hypothetical protein [Myxococcales bacterium]
MSHDSGVDFGPVEGLGWTRLTLHVTFGAPPRDCGAGCIESVHVGLTRQTPTDATDVRPVVALGLSGARRQMLLTVEGTIVAQWPFDRYSEGRDEPTQTRAFSLIVRPDGVATVQDPDTGATVASARFEVPTRARLVAYGRNVNPGPRRPGARLVELRAETAACDMPASWSGRSSLVVLDQYTRRPYEGSQPSAPSLAYDDDGVAALAFADEGRILVAKRPDPARPGELILVDDAGNAALRPTAETERYDDPELVWYGTLGVWWVYYTVRDAEGRALRIERAVLDASARRVEDRQIVLSSSESRTVEMPTVARSHAGIWVMIVRARVGDGTDARFSVYRSIDGVSWEAVPSSLEFVIGARALGASEIDAPALARHGDTWQLVFAALHGTRWAIHAAASDDIIGWRLLEDGNPVLTGSGEGFDRLGVRGPDLASRPGALELVYVGLDGARGRFGLARRDAATGGTRP